MVYFLGQLPLCIWGLDVVGCWLSRMEDGGDEGVAGCFDGV